MIKNFTLRGIFVIKNFTLSGILVEGARRIGKSTLVEQFAKQEYES